MTPFIVTVKKEHTVKKVRHNARNIECMDASSVHSDYEISKQEAREGKVTTYTSVDELFAKLS